MSHGPPAMADWLEAELYRRRTLQLAGPLDDEAGGRLAAALMALDAEGDEGIELRLTSGGGSLDAAVLVIDTVELLGVPVKATAVGAVAGPAAFVLALCPVRRASASALIRLSEAPQSHEGRPDDLVRAAAEDRRRMDQLTTQLAAVTGRPVEEIESDIRGGRTFTAEEALRAGLIDELLVGGRRRDIEARPNV